MLDIMEDTATQDRASLLSSQTSSFTSRGEEEIVSNCRLEANSIRLRTNVKSRNSYSAVVWVKKDHSGRPLIKLGEPHDLPQSGAWLLIIHVLPENDSASKR